VTALVALAERIAFNAHSGQRDKAGRDYFGHVERVAARVHTDDEKAVAYLHDTIEDTELTEETLVELGIPQRLVDAVVLLSRNRWRTKAGYYAAVRSDPLSLKVKLADVADNSDPARLALLDEKTRERLTAKYAEARYLLTGDG
jgi:(p)ppGpp synthase/HD superfamily hydrolase